MADIRENVEKVLEVLANAPRDDIGFSFMTNEQVAHATHLHPAELNEAIALLVDSGYVEWRQYLGTTPYLFKLVQITPSGRYQYERIKAAQERGATGQAVTPPALPPVPVGSPYGFQDVDWEIVAELRSRADRLVVVLGCQFQSEHYDTTLLRANIEKMFTNAVHQYNAIPGAIPAELLFRSLQAGFGEHLFNEIARDIISADIAVFETSDFNPNVMIEMGVALTWGIRVLPVRRVGRPVPPADISGQTWADYENSGANFPDPDHGRKLLRMVERAVRKKLRKE